MVDIFAYGVVGVMHPDVKRVGPLCEGVIETHLEVSGTNGASETVNDIHVRTGYHAIPVGLISTAPQTIAVVVLGD